MTKLDEEQRSRLLGCCSLFSGVAPPICRELARKTSVVSYRKGQIIFAQGTQGHEMMVIARGAIKITTVSETGKEAILNYLKEGQVFGELALVDGKPRSASAVAAEPSEILVLKQRDMIPVMKDHAELSLAIMQELARKLRKTTADYEDLVFLDVAARLARYLTRIMDASDIERGGSGAPVNVELSQTDIGRLIGASREHVNKVLQSWRNEGLVTLEKGRITISDIKALLQRYP